MPKPDPALPTPPTDAAGAHFDDRPLMTVGIPAFGLSIPWLTGLYGDITPAQGLYWLGQTLFIALAAAIWVGNRWLLFRQREHFDWFRHPVRKLVLLVTVNVVYTAPSSTIAPMPTSTRLPIVQPCSTTLCPTTTSSPRTSGQPIALPA